MAGTLYLVPTPIGNLGDISQRCRDTLAQADFIAAEDTRVSLKLLNHLELKKPLVSYYEHNQAESGPKILQRLLAGETCALVSDAGSPAISDPGEGLDAPGPGAGAAEEQAAVFSEHGFRAGRDSIAASLRSGSGISCRRFTALAM